MFAEQAVSTLAKTIVEVINSQKGGQNVAYGLLSSRCNVRYAYLHELSLPA
ncbi:hypothetical protein WI664_15420 [Vibrio cholerae]